LIDSTSIAYAIAAIIGMVFYIWNGWPDGVDFNPQKAFNTLIRGGAISIIGSAAILAQYGLSVELLGVAFMAGFTLDAGLKKVSDTLVPTIKPTAPE
jgi:hypothetical protein